jgi:hypothetical protein
MQYGAARQAQVSYTGTLMNEGFDTVPYVESVVDASAFVVNNYESSRIKLSAATMILEGAINYRVKFTITDAALKKAELGMEYTFKGATETAPIELENGTYYAYIRNVAAKDMDEILNIKAYYVNASGERVYFADLTYNGYIYAARQINSAGNNTKLIEMSKAFAMYIYYANANFAK